MNLEQLTFYDFLLIFVLIWLAVLSFQHFKAVSHYKKLIRNSQGMSLEKVLENVIANQENIKKRLTTTIESLTRTQKEAENHIQKYALIRFNPFEDAGGDQSFCAAFLDANNDGVVISSLHSRSGTRVYAKSIVSAKATTHSFTKEEKEAVEKAVKQGTIRKDTKND